MASAGLGDGREREPEDLSLDGREREIEREKSLSRWERESPGKLEFSPV